MNAPVTQAAEGLARRAFTVGDVQRMVEVGLIPPDERIEVLGGEIVPMSPKGARHEAIKVPIGLRWGRLCPTGYVYAQETGLYLDEHTYLEPDFVVYRKAVGLAALRGPEVLLAVEVADSSLDYDLRRKPLIYGEFGVRELWVIDAAARIVHVHAKRKDGSYAAITVHQASERQQPTEAPAEFGFALDELEAV